MRSSADAARERNPTEVDMSSTEAGSDAAPEAASLATIPMRFEVTRLPVGDVDRAKAFYQRLGWRLDIDFHPTPETRGVQFTPPGGAFPELILVVEHLAAPGDHPAAPGAGVGDGR
jgi:hypothetical protein